MHLIRYHGVFAANHLMRAQVLPIRFDEEEDAEDVRRKRRRKGWHPPGGLVPELGWVTWAQLLKRVFAVDVLKCTRCRSRRVVLAVTEPDAVPKILAHLGLGRSAPVLQARFADGQFVRVPP